MESFTNMITEQKKRHRLVLEHARLAAEYAKTPSDEILGKMSDIESQLAMTTEQIASIAMSIYHKDY